MNRKRPHSDRDGRYGRFNCFLCWVGFDYVDGLCNHYGDEEHVGRMKKYGVERMLREERR